MAALVEADATTRNAPFAMATESVPCVPDVVSIATKGCMDSLVASWTARNATEVVVANRATGRGGVNASIRQLVAGGNLPHLIQNSAAR